MLRLISPRFHLGLVLGVLAVSAPAQTITGTVVTSAGSPVVGAVIHFSGTATPPDATTGATGAFTAPVSAGVFTVDVEPPVTTLAPKRLEGVIVTAGGTTALGTITLAPGIAISGHVQTQTGASVVNGDTDVVDAVTGQKLYTPNDNTDASGNYALIVPAGTFRVVADAPTGQLLVSQESAPFTVVAAPVVVPTIVLPPGVALSGTVKNAQTQLPIPDVDIDVDDMVTGQRVITPTDTTSATGFFSVVVPTGLYRLAFDPAPGVSVAGAELFNVPITGPLNVGNVFLNTGFLLSGTVLNPQGQPVIGADIDIENMLGAVKVYTPNDTTLSNGTFQVAVAAGSYRVRVQPPATPLLVAGISGVLNVSAPMTVPTFVLQTGFALSGTIHGWDGGPEKFARLDVINPSTGAELNTPNDMTSASGAYSIVVPAGTWTVRVRCDHGSLSRNSDFTGVVVNGPTTFGPTLTQVPLACYLAPAAATVVPNGGLLLVHAGIYNPTFVPQTMNLSISIIDPTGVAAPLASVPITMLPFDLILITDFPIPLPAFPPAWLGYPGKFRFTVTDPVTLQVVDFDDIVFIQA